MVVGHLRCVENTFALLQRLATDGFDEFCIYGYAVKFRLIQSVQCLWTFGVDIV